MFIRTCERLVDVKVRCEEDRLLDTNKFARRKAPDVELVAATCRTYAALLRNFKRVLFAAFRVSADFL